MRDESTYYDVERAIELAFEGKFVIDFYQYLKVKKILKSEVDEFIRSSTASEIRDLDWFNHHVKKGEKVAIKNFLKSKNIPILGEITDPGKLESGDIVWINQNTIAVGVGYRTNMDGIKQLSNLLTENVKEIIPVPLPHWNLSLIHI